MDDGIINLDYSIRSRHKVWRLESVSIVTVSVVHSTDTVVHSTEYVHTLYQCTQYDLYPYVVYRMYGP